MEMIEKIKKVNEYFYLFCNALLLVLMWLGSLFGIILFGLYTIEKGNLGATKEIGRIIISYIIISFLLYCSLTMKVILSIVTRKELKK